MQIINIRKSWRWAQQQQHQPTIEVLAFHRSLAGSDQKISRRLGLSKNWKFKEKSEVAKMLRVQRIQIQISHAFLSWCQWHLSNIALTYCMLNVNTSDYTAYQIFVIVAFHSTPLGCTTPLPKVISPSDHLSDYPCTKQTPLRNTVFWYYQIVLKKRRKRRNFKIELSFWRPDFNLHQNVKYW